MYKTTLLFTQCYGCSFKISRVPWILAFKETEIKKTKDTSDIHFNMNGESNLTSGIRIAH